MKNLFSQLFSQKHTILLLCIFFYALVFHTGFTSIEKAPHGRDFATYYYANKITQVGENPYHTPNLSKQSKLEKTRKSVHPFFYPPPALLFFSWTSFFSLFTSYKIFFVANQILFGIILWFSREWLRISWGSLLILACTFTPIQNSIVMGQVNVIVVFFLLYALRFHNGPALACAGMIKMSPIYIMFQWMAERKWNATLYTVLTAVFLSILSLIIINFNTQVFFFTDILPSFSSGNYNGLRIPITLPANHSIPDIWNQLFPGPNNKTLSVVAKQYSLVLSTLLLGILLLCAKLWKGSKVTKFLSGAFIVLFMITPIYTYEHHVSFALIPILFFIEFLSKKEIENHKIKYLFGSIYFFLAWPLWMLRGVQNSNEVWNWLLQESKFFALLALFFLCLYVAYISREENSNSITAK
jgi:hypothetical protein